MKTTFLRMLLALVALTTLSPFATADQRGFGNVLGQWSNQPSAGASDYGVEDAAYAGDRSNESVIPAYGEQFAGDIHCPSNGYGMSGECVNCNCYSCQGGGTGGCSDGSCYSGDCYGGECYGGECYGGSCSDGYCPPCGDCNAACGRAGMCYAEVQNMFLRAHVSSDVIGKLSEKYEYSPRFVVGWEAPNGLGVRGRYWTYSHTTSTLDGTNSLGLDFDVVDLEGTARFSTPRADLLIAGGARWAHMGVEEDDDGIGADMPGITFAADGRYRICGKCHSQWSGVAGARWSLLGGDWDGDSNNLIQPTYDDNVDVQEIYGGVEYLCHHGSCDLYCRLVFEVQNWHSDALGENSATDSIGFVGPSIQAGVSY